MPGMSVFYKNAAGTVFHTYSTYGRGAEELARYAKRNGNFVLV